MSTDRIQGEIVFICDGCDDTLETDAREFGDANEARKEAGWIAVPPTPPHEVWQHFCPTCKKEPAR